uniref:Secreted protein n=1 Tax=Parascaris univalens TaxID=6257 RepID=A0A915A136_PARUN
MNRFVNMVIYDWSFASSHSIGLWTGCRLSNSLKLGSRKVPTISSSIITLSVSKL